MNESKARQLVRDIIIGFLNIRGRTDNSNATLPENVTAEKQVEKLNVLASVENNDG